MEFGEVDFPALNRLILHKDKINFDIWIGYIHANGNLIALYFHLNVTVRTFM